MHRQTWERICQLFKVSSRIVKISRWNRCLMLQHNWWITRTKSMVWTKFSGKKILGHVKCHWLVMKQSSIFKAQKSMSSRILCCASEGSLQHPDSNEAWKNRITEIQSGKSYKDYDAINGGSTEFEWNIFPRFTTLQLCGKINDLLSNLGQTTETFTKRILFMSMFNDISCDRKGNKDECLANAGVVKVLAKRFGIGQWSFSVQVLKRSDILEKRTVHKEFGIISRTPQINYQLTQFFALSLLSINQLSVHGAVATLSEEFDCHQDGSSEPEILIGQSIVLGEVKAEILLQNEDSMNDQILWQHYIQRIESLSPESKVSRFCK